MGQLLNNGFTMLHLGQVITKERPHTEPLLAIANVTNL